MGSNVDDVLAELAVSLGVFVALSPATRRYPLLPESLTRPSILINEITVISVISSSHMGIYTKYGDRLIRNSRIPVSQEGTPIFANPLMFHEIAPKGHIAHRSLRMLLHRLPKVQLAAEIAELSAPGLTCLA